jgi:UDP-N-acetyl-D-glucosamine dehydrogenase
MLSKLLGKINNRQATIGIIGLGYVGLPLMLRYVEVGFQVIGFDIDEGKVGSLNSGQSYINHISSERIKQVVTDKMFSATTDFSEAVKADALLICVPTPLTKYREPDLSYVTGTLEALLPFLRKGQVVSLESTTYPGTTCEVLRPRIESRDLVIGQDVFLVYSPEREDPANQDYTTSTIPKICGADTVHCLKAGVALYEQVIDQVVQVSSTRSAEMTKLLENIYRAVNIGLVNELKIVADKMDIDIWEVINAAATKPFGFTPFFPGPGLGVHCIPIDPFYLTWKAREYGLHTRFIELAGEINTSMPEWVVGKVVDVLNSIGKALSGAEVLILGIAYKKNVDDMRESPSVMLMEILQKKGAKISYSDPYVKQFPVLRDHFFNLSSVEINADMLPQYDCVLIATDHDDFDYDLIVKKSKMIIVTRGVYKEKRDNVFAA